MEELLQDHCISKIRGLSHILNDECSSYEDSTSHLDFLMRITFFTRMNRETLKKKALYSENTFDLRGSSV